MIKKYQNINFCKNVCMYVCMNIYVYLYIEECHWSSQTQARNDVGKITAASFNILSIKYILWSFTIQFYIKSY